MDHGLMIDQLVYVLFCESGPLTEPYSFGASGCFCRYLIGYKDRWTIFSKDLFDLFVYPISNIVCGGQIAGLYFALRTCLSIHNSGKLRCEVHGSGLSIS